MHPEYIPSPGHVMRVSCCLLADGILYWTPLILDGILTGNFNGKVVTGIHGMLPQETLSFLSFCVDIEAWVKRQLSNPEYSTLCLTNKTRHVCCTPHLAQSYVGVSSPEQ